MFSPMIKQHRGFYISFSNFKHFSVTIIFLINIVDFFCFLKRVGHTIASRANHVFVVMLDTFLSSVQVSMEVLINIFLKFIRNIFCIMMQHCCVRGYIFADQSGGWYVACYDESCFLWRHMKGVFAIIYLFIFLKSSCVKVKIQKDYNEKLSNYYKKLSMSFLLP